MSRRMYVVALAILGMSIAATSCRNDDEFVEPSTPNEIKNYTVSSNIQELSSRIRNVNQLIPVEKTPTGALKNGIKHTVDLAKNYAFTLQAEVPSPIVLGKQVQATHVSICYPFAIVAYNTKGNDYRGGIEVFNVSHKCNPVIVSQALFPFADINAVDYYNGKIYVVGATEPSLLNLPSAAFMQVLDMDNEGRITGSEAIVGIGSYAGTDIRVTPEYIYVSSGSGTDGKGGVKVFDHSYHLVYEKEMDHARSIQVKNGQLYTMQSEPARISVFDLASLPLVNTFNIQGANTPDSKSEIDVNDKYIFAALNEEGLKVINRATGALKQHIPRPATIPGGLDENFVTNSVSIYTDLVLIANGQAGISVGGIIPENQDNISVIGKFTFNDGESSNYVEQKDSVIFVATGKGGLKIITVSVDDGKPENPIPTTLCPTLLANIRNLFPEGRNNMEARPTFFDPSIPNNLLITQRTKVYLTFADENACCKNSFGYYAYPADNPPKTVNELVKHIVFPNISKKGSGGALLSGDMVQLGDSEFPENTVIGFFLVNNGWLGGQVTDGYFTMYTNTELNFCGVKRHVLFIDNSCNDLVITFEDGFLYDADKDFNDTILVISDDDNPATANSRIRMNGYPKWPL